MTRTSDTRGFTLIELVVALTIFAIMLAAVLPMTSNLLRAGNNASSQGRDDSSATVVAQLMESDLQALGADYFGGRTSWGVDSLVTALNSGTSKAAFDEHDILYAGPTAIEFWANELSAGGLDTTQPVIIKWYLLTNNAECGPNPASNWCVVREVDSTLTSARSASNPSADTAVDLSHAYDGVYGGASDTISASFDTDREIVSYGKGAYPVNSACPSSTTKGPRLFCYEQEAPAASYTWASWTSACNSQWKATSWKTAVPRVDWGAGGIAGAPATFTTGTAMNASYGEWYWNHRIEVDHHNYGTKTYISPLDTISTIEIYAPAGSSFGGGTGSSYVSDDVALQSRSGISYRTAIGCGTR